MNSGKARTARSEAGFQSSSRTFNFSARQADKVVDLVVALVLRDSSHNTPLHLPVWTSHRPMTTYNRRREKTSRFERNEQSQRIIELNQAGRRGDRTQK